MPLSGPSWVRLFPTSSSAADLVEPFRASVQNFLKALAQAGATVHIADTLRPQQRASLMYYSYQIAKASADPAKIPPIAGADIQWVHTGAEGNPDLAASQSAAAQMMAAYGIVYEPALCTLHATGEAIDIDISWTGDLSIENAGGSIALISSLPRNGENTDLHQVGKTYGVIKLVADPPHWSATGQ